MPKQESVWLPDEVEESEDTSDRIKSRIRKSKTHVSGRNTP
jgi:hypothetical protein